MNFFIRLTHDDVVHIILANMNEYLSSFVW